MEELITVGSHIISGLAKIRFWVRHLSRLLDFKLQQKYQGLITSRPEKTLWWYEFKAVWKDMIMIFLIRKRLFCTFRLI